MQGKTAIGEPRAGNRAEKIGEGERLPMCFEETFERYEILVEKADEAFSRMKKDHPGCIECRLHCSDCCNAVFGLFLVEAAYIQRHFAELGERERQEAISRADASDRDLEDIQRRLRAYRDNPVMSSFSLSKERMRCPLLSRDEACVLYARRPITCRVYGIPTAIRGAAHVCEKAAFGEGRSYPTFDLDAAHKALYLLSRELLERAGQRDMERASYLVSVSKALRTPVEDLIRDP